MRLEGVLQIQAIPYKQERSITQFSGVTKRALCLRRLDTDHESGPEITKMPEAHVALDVECFETSSGEMGRVRPAIPPTGLKASQTCTVQKTECQSTVRGSGNSLASLPPCRTAGGALGCWRGGRSSDASPEEVSAIQSNGGRMTWRHWLVVAGVALLPKGSFGLRRRRASY